jgi:hypothetical protein
MARIIKTEDGDKVIKLSEKDLKELSESKKDIENGSFVVNKLLNKEVKLWLKLR